MISGMPSGCLSVVRLHISRDAISLAISYSGEIPMKLCTNIRRMSEHCENIIDQRSRS